jgi:hypothetical protein
MDSKPMELGPLALSLAKAQASFAPVTRSKTVTVQTKTGGSYKFAYAPLDAILDAVRKPLSDNGLAIAQLIDHEALVTVLLHESGAFLQANTALPTTGDVQALGSAITYLRRYALQAMLGIAAEEDDDGHGAKDAKPAKPTGEYGKAPFPKDAPQAPETAPTPFRPLGGSEVPTDGEPEPSRPKPTIVPMVQCESRSPFDEAQCRREQGHTNRHRTESESWSDADAKSVPAADQHGTVA